MVNQKFLERAYSPSTKDLTGQKFGMLTVIEQHGFKKPNKLLLTNLFPGLVLVFLIVGVISSATDLIGWIASPTASAVKEITSMIK